MKTIKKIKSEIQELDTLKQNRVKPAEWKRAGKKRKLLTKCIYYLEESPSETFLKRSYDAIKKKIELIDSGYGAWYANHKEANSLKNPRSAYNSEMGMRELKLQLSTLKYLLN